MTMLTRTTRPISRLLLALARLGLAGVLLWSGISKLRQPYDFLAAVYQYELVGPKVGVFIAATLPWLEIFASIAMLTGIGMEGGFCLSALLGATFVIALASAIHRGLDIDCGCFGRSIQAPVGTAALLRAIGVLVVSVLGFFLAVRCRAPAPVTAQK